MPSDIMEWLIAQCAEYRYDLGGVFRAHGTTTWPLQADGPADLEAKLAAGGHLLPLPKEPAALANVLEVSIVDHLMSRIAGRGDQVSGRRGGERFYPDLEIADSRQDPTSFTAVDVKVARRAITKKGPADRTQSRITLYTGNTYFKHPTLHLDGTFRPFADYVGHLDVICIYTLLEDDAARIGDLEIIVQEPWRIASKRRSSTTREYIGAVQKVADLRAGRGEFATPEEFYAFWRSFKFRTAEVVVRRMQRMLDGGNSGG